MAITLVGYQTVVVTLISTTVTIDVPSGVQPGDLLLVHLAVRYVNAMPSIPTGWRFITQQASVDTTGQWQRNRLFLCYRIADGTEPASYSFGSGYSAFGGMTAWRGVDTSRPFEDWALVGSVDSQSSLTFPSCGMGGSDRVVLRCYSQAGASIASVTWGSGITTIYDAYSSSYGRGVLAREDVADASPRTVTLSTAKDCSGATLVLLPAGATPQASTGYRGTDWGAWSNVTAVTVRAPLAYPGDYLVLVAERDAAATATPPAGFTLLASGAVSSTLTIDIWGRVAATNEPENVTVTFPASTSVTASLHVFRGFSVVRGVQGTGASSAASITLPALTVSDPTVIDLRIVGQSSTYRPTLPSGFNQTLYSYAIGATPHVVFHRVLVSATTTGTATVTYGSNTLDLYGFTVVLASVSAGVNLAGAAAGTATASGQLSVTRGLAGVGIGAAAARANILRVVGLVGRAEGTALAWAQLVRDVLLAGRAGGAALASGVIGVERQLAGTALGSGWAHADLSVLLQILLSGRASGSALAGGALLVERWLSASGAGGSATVGALLVERLLSGRAAGEGRVRAAILVPVLLAGRAAGAGAARGSIAAPVILLGRAVGVGRAWAPPALDLAMTVTHLRTVWALTRRWAAVEGETVTGGTVGTVVFPAELLVDPVGTGTVVVARVGLRPIVPTTAEFAVGVESALAALEPGDVVPVVLPLAPGGGAVGLCRVLAIDEDPDRGEVRLQVQFIGQLEAEDVAAFQDVGRPRVATDRATNLGRTVRELRRR
ncbi:hypothetical protein OO015_13820 (plasmid) [Thermomicrobium sp. 4228-Ro]|uniref:hypothetical protein n=1 Tax=Thermomicrobium sp. 4228-Ro TaxID=2993937 RepID=UPI0022497393|nr:hypothetical protein [Thermomicrobium sp. 4228-Ro]MCX2728563.1 hypothetical protein [Thermomicrobium sp. 4228-Ro]